MIARIETEMPRSAPVETADEINSRCAHQLADCGSWPLSRTAEIASQQGHRLVE